MVNIILSGVHDTRNNGCWAMVQSTVSMIMAVRKDIQFTYIMDAASIDDQRLRINGMRFVISPWTKCRIPKIRVIYTFFCLLLISINLIMMKTLNINIFYRNFCKSLHEADQLIDLSGDSLSTDYPDYSVLLQISPSLFMSMLKKPYCFCAQSIGPFKPGILYALVKRVLLKSSLITAREQIPHDLLLSNNISKNVSLTCDTAFALEPVPQNELENIAKTIGIDRDKRYVGVSTSNLVDRFFSDKSLHGEGFIRILAGVCDYIVETYKAEVILIPHVTRPASDDRIPLSALKNMMRHKGHACFIESEYNGAELKGIISYCDAFISTRMHAAIAAISQHIPALVFSYNHKTHGIFGDLLDMKELIVDIKDTDIKTVTERTRSQAGYMMDNIGVLSARLKKIIPKIKESASENVSLCLNQLK